MTDLRAQMIVNEQRSLGYLWFAFVCNGLSVGVDLFAAYNGVTPILRQTNITLAVVLTGVAMLLLYAIQLKKRQLARLIQGPKP